MDQVQWSTDKGTDPSLMRQGYFHKSVIPVCSSLEAEKTDLLSYGMGLTV